MPPTREMLRCSWLLWAIAGLLAAGRLHRPVPRSTALAASTTTPPTAPSSSTLWGDGVGGGGEEDERPPQTSEDNLRALQANEESLPFYKSLSSWNSEYISAKVNSALNSDIQKLNKIARGADSSRSGKKGKLSNNQASATARQDWKTKAGGQNQKGGGARQRFKRADVLSLGEEQVRSGLLAMLTLHDLATGARAAEENHRGGNINSTEAPVSTWKNPESPEQLALFTAEVEKLGSGHAFTSSSTSGLRVSGAKKSWKQMLRTQASSDSSLLNNDVPDIDRLVINDLAENLLKVVKEDLSSRLSRRGGATQTTNDADAAAAPLLQAKTTTTATIKTRQKRKRGREKARMKGEGGVSLLGEYDMLGGGGGGSGVGGDENEEVANVGFPRPLGSQAFLASPKRFTEISKVTRELFSRRGEMLFRPGFCACLGELTKLLIVWSKHVRAVEPAADVLSAVAIYGKAPPPLEAVLALFTPPPAQAASSYAYWTSYLKVYLAIKEQIMHRLLTVGDDDYPKEAAATTAVAVSLLKMGIMASIRAGAPQRERETNSSSSINQMFGNSTMTPTLAAASSLGSSSSSSATSAQQQYNATEVYDSLGQFLHLVREEGARTEFSSSVVKAVVQRGHLDSALALFKMVLRERNVALQSKVCELLLAKLVERGRSEDQTIVMSIMDLLLSRRHVPTLGTLKLFIKADVQRQAGKQEPDKPDWKSLVRVLRGVASIASKTDSRPKLLQEYLALLLIEYGLASTSS